MQTDRQTDRQTDTHTHTHTYTYNPSIFPFYDPDNYIVGLIVWLLPQQSKLSGIHQVWFWRPEVPEAKINISASSGPEQRWSLALIFFLRFARTMCQSHARSVPEVLTSSHALAARSFPDPCQNRAKASGTQSHARTVSDVLTSRHALAARSIPNLCQNCDETSDTLSQAIL